MTLFLREHKKAPEQSGLCSGVFCVDKKESDPTGAPHGGAARLRCTSIFAKQKSWRRANSLRPSILTFEG
ncbi:MAG: hypothetical protein KH338_07730 [Oscillospiraceae bacterium]|nr:hypothetical protein [Oscillospiraceae bacterium]